ncbi:glycosyltransferase family 2 protein [Nitrosopumilus cobalaminigenes]|uniref:glycosyltransferase family 2 protein n=1 Tax=Nitrosopumilus cobalaminigenes TaxID=1470066 RepID=UPI0015C9A42C|nr:glycosyltransferase family 2 protein [Nitrosopumilus cobalaminigenes]
MKIAVGLPAYNEEKNIASIITKLEKIADIVIVCDDGSSDLTGKIATKMGAMVITHEKNKGYGAAIRSLFLKSKDLDVDILVTFDADGQHSIDDISKVIQPIIDKKSDLVIGSRFLDESKDDIPSYRKTGIQIITKLTNTTLKEKIKDSQSGFRAYSKDVLSKILPSDSGMGVSSELLIKASNNDFKIAEIPIKISYEGDTSTHHPVSHGMSVTLSTLKFISIEHPLKFYGIPGLAFLFIGLFFTVWTLQLFSETREIITNISLLAIGTIIFGTMLFMTSIILYSIVNLVRERN